ncbi:MAG: HD family phosphohydrolase [Lysobacterales bacterium CG17_big_fil_post_rev_8_21_14_2_50_64_11]|nr:MAG: HD family phosphohydrolase [Xanthomonadales bacterium CG17_big_fil_post_rev_8_21_14_2_50_64_11]PIX60163.1 MAG: HD family phosphohydrolase [Xanthomonadales bacterium CG_4_10_14_3_um_filter_64_11]
MTVRARELAALVDAVPSLPAVFLRLTAVVDDPRSAIRDMEEVVYEDPALAGRLLRLANSAYFGFPGHVDSLSRAITLVGTRQLRDLALATSVLDLFSGVASDVVSMASFWRHSVATGLLARALATWQREANAEQFFVAGLLHDIGRLVLLIKANESMVQALERSRVDDVLLHVVERDILGFDHAALGNELLRQWNLPPAICAGVAFHHLPMRAGANIPTAALVHVADVMANAIAFGSSGMDAVPPLEDAAWLALGLPVSVIKPSLDLVRQQFSDTMKIMMEPAG